MKSFVCAGTESKSFTGNSSLRAKPNWENTLLNLSGCRSMLRVAA